MNLTEKISDKKAKIEKSRQIINREQERIKKLTTEIEELESLEVKGLLKELDMPISDLKEFIKNIKSSKS